MGWMIRVLGFILFTTVSRMALGPTQPPIQWVLGGSFSEGEVVGAWGWPLTSISCWGQECMELYLYPPVWLRGV